MIDKKESQLDLRIGLYGHYSACICAVTGQPLAGRNYTTYSLGGGYYCSVLDKANYDKINVKDAMAKLVATTTASNNSGASKPKQKPDINEIKKGISHDE